MMGMNFDLRAFMRSRRFNIAFSFILGLFLVILFSPVCRGGACYTYRPPPVAEVCSGVYRLTDKCYKFRTEDVPCPPSGVIEPYTGV